MRVHVIHAHPVETSYNRALFQTVVDSLEARGHEVDALNLHEEGFSPVLTREERLRYHDVPGNVTPDIRPYVDRLRAADAMVIVFPVWNEGFPAILKGYFDRIFLPGVAFRIEGGEGKDKGKPVPCLDNIRKVAFVTTYGTDRLHAWLLGDPPRRVAMRWGWGVFQTRPHYLALYGMNDVTKERLEGFLDTVRDHMSRF